MLYALLAAAAAALLILDQWFKHWITVNLPLGEAMPFIPGIMELRTVHNYGAAWSSFSGQKWLLLIVTCGIVLAVAYVMVRRIVRHPLGLVAGFLLISGGSSIVLSRKMLFVMVSCGSMAAMRAGAVCGVAMIAAFPVFRLLFRERRR